MGQVSPVHPVPQDPAERKAAGVPPGATDFAFSYPVQDWGQVENDVYTLQDWEQCAGSVAMKSFLTVGGYLYLDAVGHAVAATALAPGGTQNNFHFMEPRRWDPMWTEPLLENGRLQQVTIRELVESGAWLFCWLQPGEVLIGRNGPFEEQPQVPHGGFVFLFHEDALLTNHADAVLDRYFPVAMSMEKPCNLTEENVPAHKLPRNLYSVAEADEDTSGFCREFDGDQETFEEHTKGSPGPFSPYKPWLAY